MPKFTGKNIEITEAEGWVAIGACNVLCMNLQERLKKIGSKSANDKTEVEIQARKDVLAHIQQTINDADKLRTKLTLILD